MNSRHRLLVSVFLVVLLLVFLANVCLDSIFGNYLKFILFNLASFATKHPDFSRLAARISVSNLHKMSDENFSDVVEKFYRYVHPKTNKPAPLVSQAFYECVMRNKERLDGAVVHARCVMYNCLKI